MQKSINLRLGILCLFILVAAFSRIIPHMPNFSPLAAIGLFGAAYFAQKWQAYFIPLFATWISDLFINNVIYGQYYPEFTWFYDGFYWQYGSYVLIVLLGISLFKKISLPRIFVGSISASLLFFLISNFGVWATGKMYPPTFEGLISCYAAGIPFIKGTFLGDLFYSGVLFGTFALAQNHFPILKMKTANS